MAQAPVVVLDTNVVLSALVFSRGSLAELRLAWQTKRCAPLVCRATAAELMRVLSYPKFKLQPEQQEELLADYLPYCRSVHLPAKPPRLPICRDLDDQVFLQLAAVGEADFLVSGDRDLLGLAGEFERNIVTVEAFILQLRQH